MSSLNFLRNSLPSAAATAAAAAAAMTGGAVRTAALGPLSVARRWQSSAPVTPVTPKTTDTFGTGRGIFSPKDDTTASASSSIAVADQSSSPTPSYTPAGQSNSGFATAADPGFDSTAHYFNSPRHQQQQNAIDYYVMHVQASFNNTLVTITNHLGDAVAMSSGGKAGFKKANRAGYEPAYQATRQVLTKLETKLGDTAHTFGLHVKLKGFGPGRDAAWKCVLAHGWRVKAVEDVTPVAHGGCRPRKARRL